MSGQMGNTIRTAMNRQIEKIDLERNLLLVRGSVPGARHTVVVIRSA
jgi:large subunit ribosomal protein L3